MPLPVHAVAESTLALDRAEVAVVAAGGSRHSVAQVAPREGALAVHLRRRLAALAHLQKE